MGAEFRVEAAAEPEVLPRILGQFAKRALVCDRLCAETIGNRQSIIVAHLSLDAATARRIGDGLRGILGVSGVEVRQRKARAPRRRVSDGLISWLGGAPSQHLIPA